jgi:hypothetical protein
VAEEVEDLVEGGPGGLARFVDEVLRQDGVGVLHLSVRVGGVVVELDGHEAVPQLLAEELEALGRDEPVAFEAQPEHLEPFLVAALLHPGEVRGRAVDAGPVAPRHPEGQRRL